ncbi:MAG: beta-lactamase family protein [Pseudomonadota bacterium]|nr:beta-lactamase family protein [Pseudomonadota bacterium]
MEKWLAAALDYLPRWLGYQMLATEQPGCVVAVAHKGKVVLERAFGHADLKHGTPLTPRHRFRVASHSKTFTAAGILKLREAGRIGLDDPVGRHVAGLAPAVASVTIGQLLSHTAGLVRDGSDSGQWTDRRPFLDETALRADLAHGTVIEPNTRFKYSNHGYGLLGLVIEALTGEPYADWIAREIVAASGLEETAPDAPQALASTNTPFARGHTGKLPMGHRVVIPGDNPTHALASATGFVSTGGDLVRFFSSLIPSAKKSVLSMASRREMSRRLWRDPHSSAERWYGLGTISGTLADWEWFGHSGSFQGTVTRTANVPAQDLSVAVLTNATDGSSQVWLDGTLHLLHAFARHGGPSRKTAAWAGRWWSLWGAVDLLAMNDKVLVANPLLGNPVQDASEIEVSGTRGGVATGRIALAGGFAHHGEPVRLVFDGRGKAKELWLAGGKLLPQAKVEKELFARYE